MKVLAKTNSFQVEIRFMVTTVTMVFLDIGRMIRKNACQMLVPSITAASSNSLGTNL